MLCPTCGKETTASGITKREQEILDLLVTGMRPRFIARELFVSVHTVDAHLQNIRQKLGVSGAYNLAAFELNRREQLRLQGEKNGAESVTKS